MPKYLVGYESLIAPTFEGTFSLQFDSKQPYTHKSQYLVEVTLTGDHASGVRGNDRDNVLMGNHGDNQLVGEGGTDTVRFSGPQKEYAVERSGTVHTVRDLIEGRDGIDTLISIEVLRFADGEVRL